MKSLISSVAASTVLVTVIFRHRFKCNNIVSGSVPAIILKPDSIGIHFNAFFSYSVLGQRAFIFGISTTRHCLLLLSFLLPIPSIAVM